MEQILDIKNKDVFDKIITEIADFDYDPMLGPKEIGLFNGYSGLSLMLFNAYQYSDNSAYMDKAMVFFSKAYSKMNAQNLNLSYGASGVMWLLNYLNMETNGDKQYEELLVAFDCLLLKKILEQVDHFDPMHGVLSIANYLFSRNTPEAVEALKVVLDAIDYEKVEQPIGIAWEMGRNDKDPEHIAHINFGYAHGIPAILYFLSKFIQRGIEKERSIELFKKGYEYFISFADFSKAAFFPSLYQQGEIKRTTRISYCYGDLGIANSLLAIGKNLNDAAILELCKKTAINIAELSIAEINQVHDIGLCHGAAGNGYMFMKLYRHFKLDVLKEAAVTQYNRLLDLAVPGTGIAGLRSIDYDKKKEAFYKKSDPGFISGTTGVALSLISLLNDQEDDNWGSILFLD